MSQRPEKYAASTSSFFSIATISISIHAQTVYRISNATITEKDQVTQGTDVTANIRGAEGSDRVVIHANQEYTVTAWVKVSTHNVKRSSVKNSAVNAIFELDLKAAGKKDGRRVEKIFYGDQERKTHIKEVFTIKHGIHVRTITVEYDGSLE